MTDERIKEIVAMANDLSVNAKMRPQVLELVDELMRLRAIIDKHLLIGVTDVESDQRRNDQGS